MVELWLEFDLDLHKISHKSTHYLDMAFRSSKDVTGEAAFSIPMDHGHTHVFGRSDQGLWRDITLLWILSCLLTGHERITPIQVGMPCESGNFDRMEQI